MLRREIINRGQIPTLFLQVREQVATMDMILGKADDVQEVG